MSKPNQYLLGLYVAEHQGTAPISPGVVAERVGRSPATVIEVFRQLETDDLLHYEPYKGATLSDSGRRRAEELHDSYVALSWFFRSILELDDYETEAMELAGVVSPAVVDRLVATLPFEGEE